MTASKFIILISFVVWAFSAQAQGYLNSDLIVGELVPQHTGPVVRSMSSATKRTVDVQTLLPSVLDLPSVSLTVDFEPNSAILTLEDMVTLRSLAKALLDPRLENMSFHIAAHVDGGGDPSFSQKLSNLRATTVVNHLVNWYGIPSSRLFGVGYGFAQPLDAGNLKGPLNRRVEIINLAPLSEEELTP